MHAADYHERTKHRLDGYAAGPGGLDWADQPAAFRDYGDDCPKFPLPAAQAASAPGFAAIADGLVLQPDVLSEDSLGNFLSCSLAIAAWKRYGSSRWALRCNPSSGNLHPTEAYLVLPDVRGLSAGLFHYQPQQHQLEQRCRHSADFTQGIFRDVPEGSFLIGISTIPWREAWKYGERAWRYCLLDLGHAVAALRYAAALRGWQIELLDHLADIDVACLLGLDRAGDFFPEEPEYPELLCRVSPNDAQSATTYQLPEDLSSALLALDWHGQANRLSPHHNHHWPVIEAAIQAAGKEGTASLPTSAPRTAKPVPFATGLSAVQLIHRRRSAQAFDGITGLTRRQFFSILDHCLPRGSLPPWGNRPQPSHVHLILFVHRIKGLSSGLYALCRDPQALPLLKDSMRHAFVWEPVPDAPDHLPLYLLLECDSRQVAARYACLQDIAADGAFCIALLGEFQTGLGAGSWGYRHLMMEAGMIGQVLYLGAEASDMQGTGIGCFFDDALHELFGLTDRSFQVLYQFTLGKGLIDSRIASEPPYPHLNQWPESAKD